MAMQWNNNLSVGVDVIDNQHKGIISRINDLLHAMSQGKGKNEVGKVLTFLADYVVKHFSAEEALMRKYNFTGYAEQQAEHAQFIKDFSLLKNEFETRGITSTLVLQIQRQLCDWLTNHIINKDKQIGAYIKQCA
ncbi:MAG: hemerythrin family protein [Candidatus Brocadia sp.]|nr:hemerythrin family protein [Candidatus Brocadia sp.]